MAAAPAAAAVWADVLWCLGLGCLLWAVRDGAELLVGRGPVRCFVLDLLAFTAAAVLLVGFSAGVSAAGLARWPHGSSDCCWPRLAGGGGTLPYRCAKLPAPAWQL